MTSPTDEKEGHAKHAHGLPGETIVKQSALRLWLLIAPVSLVLADLLLLVTRDRLRVDRMLWVNLQFAVISLAFSPWFARHTAFRVSAVGISGLTIWARRVALRWSDGCRFCVRRIGGVKCLEVLSLNGRGAVVAPVFALDRESMANAVRHHLPDDHPALHELLAALDRLERRGA